MDDINETPASEVPVIVSLEVIKAKLKQGVTRRIGDPGYMAEIGSIQEYYGMNKAEVTALFQDTRLRGLKVSKVKPSRIIIAEDLVSESEELEEILTGPGPITEEEVATQPAPAENELDEIPTSSIGDSNPAMPEGVHAVIGNSPIF